MPQSAKNSVLCVSADPVVPHVLRAHAEMLGCECEATSPGEDALAMVRRCRWRVVILDGQSEQETLATARALAEARPGQPLAALSLGHPARILTQAVLGDLLVAVMQKPWTADDLEVLLHRADATNRRAAQLEALQQTAAGSPPQFAAPDEGEHLACFGPILELSLNALDAFSPNLSAGARRARALCETLVQIGSVPAEDARPLVLASVLHDFTLMRRDRRVVCRWLINPSLCTPEQREDIQRHPAEVAAMLRAIPGGDAVAEICLHHAELFNGTGYPSRLRGEMIPWPARLLCAANHFAFQFGHDADVLRRMESESKALFDPDAIAEIKTALPLVKLPRLVREVQAMDLRAGMELAREILNQNQEVLLPRGHVLTDAEIRRLAVMGTDGSGPTQVLVLG